jgi:hypothetical protein
MNAPETTRRVPRKKRKSPKKRDDQKLFIIKKMIFSFSFCDATFGRIVALRGLWRLQGSEEAVS